MSNPGDGDNGEHVPAPDGRGAPDHTQQPRQPPLPSAGDAYAGPRSSSQSDGMGTAAMILGIASNHQKHPAPAVEDRCIADRQGRP